MSDSGGSSVRSVRSVYYPEHRPSRTSSVDDQLEERLSAIRNNRNDNVYTRSPFKQGTKREATKPETLARMTPDQNLLEQTARATAHVAQMMSRESTPVEKKSQGRLLKGHLQPLNPVKNEGPAIHQCRGIQPGGQPGISGETFRRRQEVLGEYFQHSQMNGNKMSANSINKFKMNKFYDSYANNDGRVSFEVVDEDRWHRLDSGDDDREPVDGVEESVDENFNNNNNNDSSSEDEAHVDGNDEQNDDRRTHEPDEIRGSNELPKVSISLLRQSRTSGNIENGSDRGFVGVSFLEADLIGCDRPAADPVSRCNRPSSAAVRAFNVSSLRTNNFKTWQDLEELYGDRTSLTMSNLAALDVQDCMQTHRAVIHEGQSTRRNWSVERKGARKPVQRPKSALSCQTKSAKLCQNKSGSRQKLKVTPQTLSKQSSPGETSPESNKHVMPKINSKLNSQEIPDEYSSVVDQEIESKDEQSMHVYYFVDKPGRRGSHSQMEGKLSKINEQLGDSKLAYQIHEYSVDMKDEGVQVAGLGKPGSAENALLLDLVRDQLQRDEEVSVSWNEISDQPDLIRSPSLASMINSWPPTGYVYLFAYGSDISVERFSSLVKISVINSSWALLYGFRLSYCEPQGGQETGAIKRFVHPRMEFSPRSAVQGRLYLITNEDLHSCDVFMKTYKRVTLPVWLLSGEEGDTSETCLAEYCVPASVFLHATFQ